MAIDTEGGQLVVVPPGALGIDSEARIAEFEGRDFDELEEAPADSTLYTRTDGVPLRTSSTYVFRTRRAPDPIFGRSCTFHGKLQPLRIDAALGVVEFVFDANTSLSGCNNRDLVPPR